MIDLKVAARTALVTGLGGLFATLVAVFVTYPAHNADAALVARIILVTGLLVVVLPALVRDVFRRRHGSGLASVLVGAVGGYAIDLASWAGRAYAGQAVHSPGVVTVLIDLVLWLAVVAATVQWRLLPARVRRTTSAYLS